MAMAYGYGNDYYYECLETTVKGGITVELTALLYYIYETSLKTFYYDGQNSHKDVSPSYDGLAIGH
jgi:hypothetical protein